jgi:hypothetical protein
MYMLRHRYAESIIERVVTLHVKPPNSDETLSRTVTCVTVSVQHSCVVHKP